MTEQLQNLVLDSISDYTDLVVQPRVSKCLCYVLLDLKQRVIRDKKLFRIRIFISKRIFILLYFFYEKTSLGNNYYRRLSRITRENQLLHIHYRIFTCFGQEIDNLSGISETNNKIHEF
jgi:hypothetical protein